MKKQSTSAPQLRCNRREFLLKTAAGMTIPFATLTISRVALGSEKLSEGDSLAVSLGYKRNAEQAVHDQYAAGRTCNGCAFYQGEDGAEGPCLIFGGKLVSAGGWCASWRSR